MRTNNIKSQAIGKSVYKIGLPINTPIGTKSYDTSKTRSILRRVRGGGCVAPAKKGSIYNTSLCNGKVCAWGEIPFRNNY